MQKYKAVILDRDGVINHDSDEYIKSVDEWQPIDGAIDAIVKLKRRGYIVAVASNQSGVGRGYFDLSVLKAMHNKLHAVLSEHDVALDRLYFCPHHPDDQCQCRKPRTGMLTQFAEDFALRPDQILFIGDSKSDYECAVAFGCAFCLVTTGKGEKSKTTVPKTVTVMADLSQLAFQLATQR
jgi:D-glycero-D-manno-heptose 1,7-bisphosphate phosphatase